MGKEVQDDMDVGRERNTGSMTGERSVRNVVKWRNEEGEWRSGL